MSPPLQDPGWVRYLVPNALFAGVAAGFVTCCIAGLVVSHHCQLRHVQRFHRYLSPETLYYPTVSQLRELAKGHLGSSKIAVIVGGTSRLHGTGQTASQVWTRKLQSLLGEEYQVINFGFRASRTAEIGAIAAEVLAREYPRVILITDCYPGGFDPHPDGLLYRYFFWDAYFKRLLYADPEREQRLREQAVEEIQLEQRKQGGKGSFEDPYKDLKLRMHLDSICYFTDLWNTIGYTTFFTAWTQLAPRTPTWPRRKYDDPDPGALPLPSRYPAEYRQRETDGLRGCLVQCVKDGRGRWVEAAGTWEQCEQALHTCFAAPLRPRTVMVVLRFSSYYNDALTAEQQQCLSAVCQLTVRKCEAAGMTGLEAGCFYQPEDYADFQHLAESGGAKLAADVAPKVRALARKLGYTQ